MTRPKKPKRAGFNALLQFEGSVAPARAEAWLPLPGSDPQPLELHRQGQCIWPVYDGDGPRLFCCLPVEGERRYCPAHQALGTQPVPPKKGSTK